MIEEDIKNLQQQVATLKVRMDKTGGTLEVVDSGLESVAKELASLRGCVEKLLASDVSARRRLHLLEKGVVPFPVPPAPGVAVLQAVCPTAPKLPRPKSVKLTREMLRGGLLVEFVDMDGNEPRLVVDTLDGGFVVIDERGVVTCSNAQYNTNLYQTAINRGPFGSLGVLWHEVWKPGDPGDKPWDE